MDDRNSKRKSDTIDKKCDTVWTTWTMSQITRLLGYAFQNELFFKRFWIKMYEFLKVYDCIYWKYGMNLLQTRRVQRAVFACEQILHTTPRLLHFVIQTMT